MSAQLTFDLLGVEQGRREVRTEWALRRIRDNVQGLRGEIYMVASEADARFKAAGPEWWGWKDCEVVSRRVVSYTSTWESPDSGTEPDRG